MLGLNRTIRVELKSGWLHLGESQGRAVDRAIEEMNGDGFKVVFITDDRWSLGKKIINAIITICTLGFRGRRASVLIVGERVKRDE